ncbi:MAG: hypothetical protein HC809_08325 [Gammaproteobacteria bacterium]|nr:hypothetical protein [Gammaproteobacteria bacterium]
MFARARNPQTTSNRTQAVLERFVATAASAQVVPTTAVAYPGVEQHPLTLALRLDTLPRPVNVVLPHVGQEVAVFYQPTQHAAEDGPWGSSNPYRWPYCDVLPESRAFCWAVWAAHSISCMQIRSLGSSPPGTAPP